MTSKLTQLLAELHARSRSLGILTDGQIYPGLHTPLDEVFVIDKATRDRLAIFDPTGARHMRRMLRADDVQPWSHEEVSAYVIALLPGWTAATFGAGLDAEQAWAHFTNKHPALAKHLAPWTQQACSEQHGDYWWELPPQSALAALNQPKIIWPVRSSEPRFATASASEWIDEQCGFMPFDAPPLLGMLGSRALWFAATPGQPDDHGLPPDAVMRLPIPDATDEDFDTIGEFARQISAEAEARNMIQRVVRRRVLADFGPPGSCLSEPLITWWRLDFAGLLAEVNHALGNDIPYRYRDEWRAWFEQQRAAHEGHTAAMDRLEAELNERVYALFGLVAEEIALIEGQAGEV